MNVSFLWWNTSLSPVKNRHRATEKQQRFAESMIDLFIKLEFDLIALGEVKEEDVTNIQKNCNLNDHKIACDFLQVGRTYFDSCIIYNKNMLQLLDHKNLFDIDLGHTHKIAQRYDFKFADHSVPLHIFVSHWPSRKTFDINHPQRSKYGEMLRSEIRKLFENYSSKASFILLGDYNDEPFDLPLSYYLKATRDRNLVKNKPQLLYNPFWRKIGYQFAYSKRNTEENSRGGTYYHKDGDITRWVTFDQIMFSSNFLGASEWHLNEEKTDILDLPEYRRIVLDNKEIFDHLPVVGIIERR